VEAGYVAQNRESLDNDRTVYDEISNGIEEIDLGGGRTVSTRVYTACFHFRGTDQNKRIGQLSGGERNRVHLAKMLNQGFSIFFLFFCFFVFVLFFCLGLLIQQ